MDNGTMNYVLDKAEKMYMEHKERDSAYRSDKALDMVLHLVHLAASPSEYTTLWEQLDERLKKKPRPDMVARAAKHTLNMMVTDKGFTAEDGLVWVLEEYDFAEYGLTHEQYDAYVQAIQQKIYDEVGTLEMLPMEALCDAMEDFSACESKWHSITEDVAEQQFETDRRLAERTGRDTGEPLTWPEAKKLLDAGRAVPCRLGIYRKRTEHRKCPLCGSSIIGIAALSRIDNETPLCSSCGDVEALEDFCHVVRG